MMLPGIRLRVGSVTRVYQGRAARQLPSPSGRACRSVARAHLRGRRHVPGRSRGSIPAQRDVAQRQGTGTVSRLVGTNAEIGVAGSGRLAHRRGQIATAVLVEVDPHRAVAVRRGALDRPLVIAEVVLAEEDPRRAVAVRDALAYEGRQAAVGLLSH